MSSQLKQRTDALQQAVDAFARGLFGMSLSEAQKKRVCIKCKESVLDMKLDGVDKEEYDITGLCPNCAIKGK